MPVDHDGHGKETATIHPSEDFRQIVIDAGRGDPGVGDLADDDGIVHAGAKQIGADVVQVNHADKLTTGIVFHRKVIPF